MLTKVTTFKRTVKFSRPGADVDSMVPDSFVGTFGYLSPDKLSAFRTQAGGMRDIDVAREVLKSVDGGETADVFADPIASSATVMTYFNAVTEGIAAKNSAT